MASLLLLWNPASVPVPARFSTASNPLQSSIAVFPRRPPRSEFTPLPSPPTAKSPSLLSPFPRPAPPGHQSRSGKAIRCEAADGAAAFAFSDEGTGDSSDGSRSLVQGEAVLGGGLTGGRVIEVDDDLSEMEVKAGELLSRLARATREGEARVAADAVVGMIHPENRKPLLQALFAASGCETSVLFGMADLNSDGVLDSREFSQFLDATRAANADDAALRPLNPREITQLFYRAAIGNVGFGIVDNSCMILAGDLIESTLGRAFGLSVLMSAGLGNAVSDVVGTICKEYIEDASSTLMPDLQVSSYQMATRAARTAEMAGSCVGITIGCILGLTPLLFLGTRGQECDCPPPSNLQTNHGKGKGRGGNREKRGSVFVGKRPRARSIARARGFVGPDRGARGGGEREEG